MIGQGGPTDRLLVGYAHDLAMARDVSIVDLTEDERLRVRLYELALLCGARGPDTIDAAVQTLSLRTPEAISALAFVLFRSGRVSAHRAPFETMRGWPEGRRRAFFWRYMAFTFERRITPFADPARTFQLSLRPDEKARVARLQMPGLFAGVRRTGVQFLRHKVLRTGLPADRWLDISLTLPRLGCMIPVDAWTTLARGTLGVNQAGEYLGRVRTIGAMTRRFGADAVIHLFKHYGVRSLFEQSLENGARSSKKILRNFAGRYPQVLPATVLDRLEGFTADRETFITLVNEYLLGRATVTGDDIADIVAAAFEAPLPVARAVLLCETGRRLLAALTQFKNKHDINLLRSIAFPVDASAAPIGLDGFVFELRNAFALELAIHTARRGGRLVDKVAQRSLFKKFFMLEFGVDRLSPDRIEAARQLLRARATDRVNAVFAAQGGGQRLEAQELESLTQDWRDVEPVVTLLARLSDPARRGGPSTGAAHLVLRAAKAAAQRNFQAFKFEDASAQRQLAFLSEAQRTCWKQSRALVRIGGAERPDNGVRLQELARRLDASLNSLCARAAAVAELPAELRADMAELAGEEIKANPVTVVERALATHVAHEQIPACARACLLVVAARLKGAMLGGFEQRNAVRVMRALVRIGFAQANGCESDACQGVLDDLRAIEKEIPKDLLDGETISKGMVVTALDCSPRFMLTIGDAVNTGCCLNYQNGGRINVLPAYAVDANIQALVSWQLKQTHFASVRDYKAVLNAFVAGRAATATFDGDRLLFRFTLPDGATIETANLGFAHLRQIVRLGRVRYRFSVHPGLLAERVYAQPHPLQHLMHANHADILRALSEELRAVERRPVTFPKSRNPDGVYCDALGGVQASEYSVY